MAPRQVHNLINKDVGVVWEEDHLHGVLCLPPSLLSPSPSRSTAAHKARRMSTYTAIIDDRDPLVAYVGTWSQGGAALEFDQTTSFSTKTGSTATVSFVGESWPSRI